MPTHQSHTFASRTSRHTSQSLQKSVPVPTQEEIQNIFSSPSKKIKPPDTQTNPTKTRKLNVDNGLQTRWTRTPAGNSVLPQLAVKCIIEAECYYQIFVQVDSVVLRNRQLRQHAKRYQIFIKPNSMIEEFTLWSTIQTKSKCYVIKKY